MHRFTHDAYGYFASIVVIATCAAAYAEDNFDRLIREARQAAAQGNHQQAVELLDKAIAIDDTSAGVFRLRGQQQFRAGNVKASIKDFDRVAQLKPELEKTLWERGISHYYAGMHEEGAKQFELYQTYHNADVENAAWRYLCVARADGVEQARKSLLPIENDRRVPMMKIYAMYQGEAEPADVMATAKAGTPTAAELNQRLFYAHLYVGLYYEVAGKPDSAKEHIAAAVDHPINHYMHAVARVHLERLQAKQ